MLDNTTLGLRLFSFYLGYGRAIPWRGVTRASILRKVRPNFPENSYLSYAVECEWTQHLLCCGAAIRVPQPWYLKRFYAADHPSVSRRWKTELSVNDKEAALEHHRHRMLAGIPDTVMGKERDAIVLTCEVAMLRRAVSLGRPGMAGRRRARPTLIRERAALLEPAARAKVLANLDRTIETMQSREAQ